MDKETKGQRGGKNEGDLPTSLRLLFQRPSLSKQKSSESSATESSEPSTKQTPTKQTPTKQTPTKQTPTKQTPIKSTSTKLPSTNLPFTKLLRTKASATKPRTTSETLPSILISLDDETDTSREISQLFEDDEDHNNTDDVFEPTFDKSQQLRVQSNNKTNILGHNSSPNLQTFNRPKPLKEEEDEEKDEKKRENEKIDKDAAAKTSLRSANCRLEHSTEDTFRSLALKTPSDLQRRSSLKQMSLHQSSSASNFNSGRSKSRVSFDTAGLNTSKSFLDPSPSRLNTQRLSIESSLGYAETLMHGHYTTARLKRMIKEERVKYERSRSVDLHRLKEEEEELSREGCYQRCGRSLQHFLTGYTLQDWAFLTCLGVCAAVLSFLIDLFVEKSILASRCLYGLASRSGEVALMYVAWMGYPLLLVLFSSGFTRMVGPTAIGSGIPEVKTIMKGVVLKEYLTCKTLVAKVLGLIACLGSGLPLGKVGPFVHVASVTSSLLSKLFSIFSHIKENESLQIDILTAASAVGVSCTFAAPIGGVLFSVEATATYFAVKNYWRGFYSAMCGALTFRLLSSLFQEQETLTVLFKTDLRQTMPYDVREIFVFIFVGLICGVLGAGFVWFHKGLVLLMRSMKRFSSFLQRYRFLYPSLVTLLIFSATFPPGLGQFMAGELTLKEAVNQLFDNRTWMHHQPESLDEQRMLQVWKGGWDNILLTILMFFLMKFWMCAMAATLPVPCGVFIPSFALGSALGRLTGELMAWCLPQGIRGKSIMPGAYALVGAATFSGAVTHTIATMVAGATANFLQPSVYDAMIEIKKLPYLSPSIDSEYCNAHNVTAGDIMDRDIPCISADNSYGEVWRTISACKYRAYPFVATKGSRMLAGSVLRSEVKRMLIRHFSHTESAFHEKLNQARNSADENEVNIIVNIDDNSVKDKVMHIEDELLNEVADFSSCTIDPAPFQVSSRTSLYKVHWLFSLLSLHHTFVTTDGAVVGCLSLTEVREAIQRHVDDKA